MILMINLETKLNRVLNTYFVDGVFSRSAKKKHGVVNHFFHCCFIICQVSLELLMGGYSMEA